MMALRGFFLMQDYSRLIPARRPWIICIIANSPCERYPSIQRQLLPGAPLHRGIQLKRLYVAGNGPTELHLRVILTVQQLYCPVLVTKSGMKPPFNLMPADCDATVLE